jgi:hypothetical protein
MRWRGRSVARSRTVRDPVVGADFPCVLVERPTRALGRTIHDGAEDLLPHEES